MMLRISGCWRKIFLLPTVNKLWSSYCKILARRTSLWINPFVIHTLVVSIRKILFLFALSWFGVLLIPDVIFCPFFVWKILRIFMLLLYPFCSNVAASAYIPGQPSKPGIFFFFVCNTIFCLWFSSSNSHSVPESLSQLFLLNRSSFNPYF